MATQGQSDVPISCFPDRCLSKEMLDALLNDFRSDLREELPEISTFSHLVNGIRQAYISEVLELQREVIRRSDEYEKRLSELRKLYENRPGLASDAREREHAALPVIAEQPPTRVWCVGNVLPANTVNVHVGAALGPRRDMLGWASYEQGKWGWTERFIFKAFEFLEIGTIKVTIGESSSGAHRSNAFLPTSSVPMGWAKERIHFYAFESWRPNTEMISVGYTDEPERCIYVRGDHANKLNGWTEKFVFWVPV